MIQQAIRKDENKEERDQGNGKWTGFKKIGAILEPEKVFSNENQIVSKFLTFNNFELGSGFFFLPKSFFSANLILKKRGFRVETLGSD